MTVPLIFALQAATSSAAPLPVDYDLARPPPSEWGINATGRCSSSQDPTEIVVCARRGGGGYPMEKWERVFEQKPLVAETDIGGGAIARAFVERVEMPNGEISNRMMIGIKLPF